MRGPDHRISRRGRPQITPRPGRPPCPPPRTRRQTDARAISPLAAPGHPRGRYGTRWWTLHPAGRISPGRRDRKELVHLVLAGNGLDVDHRLAVGALGQIAPQEALLGAGDVDHVLDGGEGFFRCRDAWMTLTIKTVGWGPATKAATCSDAMIGFLRVDDGRQCALCHSKEKRPAGATLRTCASAIRLHSPLPASIPPSRNGGHCSIESRAGGNT